MIVEALCICEGIKSCHHEVMKRLTLYNFNWSPSIEVCRFWACDVTSGNVLGT